MRGFTEGQPIVCTGCGMGGTALGGYAGPMPPHHGCPKKGYFVDVLTLEDGATFEIGGVEYEIGIITVAHAAEIIASCRQDPANQQKGCFT